MGSRQAALRKVRRPGVRLVRPSDRLRRRAAKRSGTTTVSMELALREVDLSRVYFAVGIANSAPFGVLSGQRCMIDFCLV